MPGLARRKLCKTIGYQKRVELRNRPQGISRRQVLVKIVVWLPFAPLP